MVDRRTGGNSIFVVVNVQFSLLSRGALMVRRVELIFRFCTSWGGQFRKFYKCRGRSDSGWQAVRILVLWVFRFAKKDDYLSVCG